MKISVLFYLAFCFITIGSAQDQHSTSQDLREQRNKEIARNFYEDLWFNKRTENYSKYVADEYVVHDTGDRKNSVEQGIEQKHIADNFWNEAVLSGEIDYQIADGDLVATRWRCNMEPITLKGKLYESVDLPIINVMRFNDEGKIVEIWNHRHDIETNQTLKFTIKGFLFGLLIAVMPILIALRINKRFKSYKTLHPTTN